MAEDTKRPSAGGDAAPRSSGAVLVAAGIMVSRLSGFVRDRAFAYFFGNSDPGDAFKAAFKIPNFLQNLFGEGVLSASFIPVYSKLLARGDEAAARKVAGVIFSFLGLIVSVLVLLGVLATPWMIDVIAPGFHGEKRELTIQLVQIFFPAAGLLVMSAWCLGILNSHRRFFLSYAAPVIWNASIIVALIGYGRHVSLPRLAIMAAWGQLIGSSLQVLIQVPTTMRYLKRLELGLDSRISEVRTVIRSFFPVVLARGVVQVSSYIDSIIASFLPTGAVSSLAYAQQIYLLPVSLFGMSVSAAELPAMSKVQGSEDERMRQLVSRLDHGLRQICYFIVPSTVAFLALGDLIIGAIYQTGAFRHHDTLYTWSVLAGSAVGLLAGTQGRLFSSAFYSLHDTKTPLRCAVARVALTTALGYLMGLFLPARIPLLKPWATAGLAASAGISGWLEFLLLRRAFRKRAGSQSASSKPLLPLIARLWVAALLSAALAWGLKLGLRPWLGEHPIALSCVTLIPYATAYLAITTLMRIEESNVITGRLKRRLTSRTIRT